MAIDPIYIHPILGELTLAEVQDNANYEEMSLEDNCYKNIVQKWFMLFKS